MTAPYGRSEGARPSPGARRAGPGKRPFALVRAVLAAVVAGAAGVAHGADDGRDVFMRYCALCHGEAADGGGQMARLLDPSPSNLRASRLDRGQRERIVRQGGASVSRSASMPAWEAELSRAQLRAVLLYLEQIRAPASAAQ